MPIMPTLLYVTVPDAITADRLARTVVNEGLAACTNRLAGMRSVYRWQGAVEEAEEVVLLVKVADGQVAAAMARLVALHPAETPCIVQLPISGGHGPYLTWLQASGLS